LQKFIRDRRGKSKWRGGENSQNKGNRNTGVVLQDSGGWELGMEKKKKSGSKGGGRGGFKGGIKPSPWEKFWERSACNSGGEKRTVYG